MNHLLSDTEIAEDHVENVLDIDPPGQPAEALSGQAQVLGDDVLAPDGPSARPGPGLRQIQALFGAVRG